MDNQTPRTYEYEQGGMSGSEMIAMVIILIALLAWGIIITVRLFSVTSPCQKLISPVPVNQTQ